MKRALVFSLAFIMLAGASLAVKQRIAARSVALDLAAGQAELIELARADGFSTEPHAGSFLGRIIAQKRGCRFTAWFALRPIYESDAYGDLAADFGPVSYWWDGMHSEDVPVATATYRYFKQGVLTNLGIETTRGAIVGIAMEPSCSAADLPDYSLMKLRAHAKPAS